MTTDTLSRTLAYVEKLPRAVAGSGGHGATFQAVLACRRFGLSEPDTWEVLQWFNAHRCDPPWTERELRHKLTSAEKISVREPLASRKASDWHQNVKPVGTLAPVGPVGFKPRKAPAVAEAMPKPDLSHTPAQALEAAWNAALDEWQANPDCLDCGQAYVRAAIVAGLPCYDRAGVDLGTDGWLAWAERELTPTAPAVDDGYWEFVQRCA